MAWGRSWRSEKTSLYVTLISSGSFYLYGLLKNYVLILLTRYLQIFPLLIHLAPTGCQVQCWVLAGTLEVTGGVCFQGASV